MKKGLVIKILRRRGEESFKKNGDWKRKDKINEKEGEGGVGKERMEIMDRKIEGLIIEIEEKGKGREIERNEGMFL